MVYHIARTLRRSYIRCFHGFVLPTRLLTPCSVEHPLSSITYLTVNAVHLQSASTFQVLSNKQSDFPSLIPLKSPLSSHLRRQFSSKSEKIISKDNSKTNQDKQFAFADSDTCLLIDAPDGLISQLTFAESKAMANKRKCRLVYMHENKDGLPCFQLQALSNTKASTASNITSDRNAVTATPTKRFQKTAVKEFRVQATISDHDFSIKLNKMKSLLVKGKQLKVLIASSGEDKNGKSVFIKRITEELGNVCQIKQDFSNDKETCLTMTGKEPADKKETD